jgi:hypothetical protein
VLMQFENAGGAFQIALFGFAADGLDFAELVETFVELAGESMCACPLA